MKKIFAIAAIALMCIPALVSCKKDNGNPDTDKNFLSIDGQEKTVVLASYLNNDNKYLLTIKLEDGTCFDFELDKANKGKKIDLLQPDPLAPSKASTKSSGVTYYYICVYNISQSSYRIAIVNGDPESIFQNPLGEGSFMQIDEKDGKIILDFELRNCPENAILGTGTPTIVGHCNNFEKRVLPPK